MPEYCTFKGDEKLPYDVIWKTGLGWLAMGSLIEAAAAIYEISVSRETMERWLRIMAFAHALDYLIDDPPPPDDPGRMRAYAYYRWATEQPDMAPPELPDGANTDLPILRALFENAAGRPSEDVIQCLHIIADCARIKNSTRWVGTYISQLRRECRATALLMTRLMTPSEQVQPGFRRLERWAIKLTKLIVSIDARKDLLEDFDAKRTYVRPVIFNRLALLGWLSFRLLAQLSQPVATEAALDHYRKILRGKLLPKWRALKARALGPDGPSHPLEDWGVI